MGFAKTFALEFGVFFSLGIELEFVSVLLENRVPIHTLDLDSDFDGVLDQYVLGLVLRHVTSKVL